MHMNRILEDQMKFIWILSVEETIVLLTYSTNLFGFPRNRKIYYQQTHR